MTTPPFDIAALASGQAAQPLRGRHALDSLIDAILMAKTLPRLGVTAHRVAATDGEPARIMVDVILQSQLWRLDMHAVVAVIQALREGSAGRTSDLPDLNLAYSALVVGYLEALKQSLLLWREAA